jgi:hypothetical protein
MSPFEEKNSFSQAVVEIQNINEKNDPGMINNN